MYVCLRRKAVAFPGKISVPILLLSIVLTAGSVPAAQNNQLDSLIVIALKNNPEIGMARYRSMAARAKIDPAGQLPDPQINVAAMNVPTNFNLTSQTMTMVPDITLMQRFPWFGKLSAAADVEKYSYASSSDRLSGVALGVVTALRKTYAAIYSTEESIKYLEYKKRLLYSLVKVAEQLFAVGQVPQQDVFRATAELTTVQSDVITMQGRLSELSAQLGAILGENYPYSVSIDTLLLPTLSPLPLLESLLGEHNPDLKEMKNIERAAQSKLELAKKAAIPDLSAGISYGYRGALMPNGTKALDMMSFEIGVSVPIFFGSKQQKVIDESDYMQRAAVEQYGSVSIGLYSRLRSAYAGAEAQSKLIPLYSNELIPQYEATYNSSLASYSVGKTSFAMLIDNLTTLINSKIEFVKIEAAYFSAAAEISGLVGKQEGE